MDRFARSGWATSNELEIDLWLPYWGFNKDLCLNSETLWFSLNVVITFESNDIDVDDDDDDDAVELQIQIFTKSKSRKFYFDNGVGIRAPIPPI